MNSSVRDQSSASFKNSVNLKHVDQGRSEHVSTAKNRNSVLVMFIKIKELYILFRIK